MSPGTPLPLLIIAGPTGVGKTAVAVSLAKSLGTEVISADSMQVYRELSIGTGKPSASEQQGVRHHCMDCVNPDVQFHAADFVADAERAIEDLRSRGSVPIVCGGTGMYIKALLHGLLPDAPANPEVRQRLQDALIREGPAALYSRLLAVDPETTVPATDSVRIVRSLEIFETTGRPASQLRGGWLAPPRYEYRYLVLSRRRECLYERIEHRVEEMFQRGLLAEVEAYLAAGWSRENPAFRALGYAEVADALAGRLSLESAKAKMKQRSRQYAKRQLTWFRGVKDAIWLPCDDLDLGMISHRIMGEMRPPTKA